MTTSLNNLSYVEQQLKFDYRHPFPQIQLHPTISRLQIHTISQTTQFDSHFLTLILYNYLQTPKLQEFLGVSLEAEGELCLVKKQLSSESYMFLKEQEKEYEYFLVYMVNENTPLVMADSSQYQKQQGEAGNRTQGGRQPLKELKPILTTLVSLCDKVVVFDLDKDKEAFVEKVFFQSVTTCQKIRWQNSTNRVNRLIFVRDCYNEQKMTNPTTNPTNPTNPTTLPPKPPTTTTTSLTASTSLTTLQYYSCLQQYTQHLSKQKQRYMYYNEQFKLVNDHQFIDRLIRRRKVVKRISLKEILQIYEKIMELMTRPIEDLVLESLLMQFLKGGKEGRGSERSIGVGRDVGRVSLGEPWKVRYYIQKVYQLQSIANLHTAIEQQIFYPDTSTYPPQYIQKQLRKYLSSPPTARLNSLLFSHANFTHFDYIPPFITQVTLSINSKEKLLWKLNRLQKFQRQLVDEAKISPAASEDKILYQLRDEEITYWLEKYKDQWTEKSLSHLKSYFSKIANQKDHKAIQEFNQQCFKMQQRLNPTMIPTFPAAQHPLLLQIRQQLSQFITYHNDVIQQRRFSGVKYFWREAGYMMRHKENVRNKIVLFGLMVVLAVMQGNVIAGVTIGTMALIVLAIRL